MPSEGRYPWFPTPRTIREDPRLLELDDHQFRVWIFMRALASDAEERGVIPPMGRRGLAAALHTTPDVLQTAIELLEEIELIIVGGDGSIEMTDFMELLYPKPSDRPEAIKERVRRFRERNADVTPLSRGSHAQVTPQKGRGESKRENLNEKGERGKKEITPPAPAPAREDSLERVLSAVDKPPSVDDKTWRWFAGMVHRAAIGAGRDPTELLDPKHGGIDLEDQIARWDEEAPEGRPVLTKWLRHSVRFWLADNPQSTNGGVHAQEKGANGARAVPRAAADRRGAEGPGGEASPTAAETARLNQEFRDDLARRRAARSGGAGGGGAAAAGVP